MILGPIGTLSEKPPPLKWWEYVTVINETSQIVNALEVGDVDLVNSVPVDEIDYIESLGYMINTQPGRYARRMPQGAKSQIYRVFTGPLSS